MASHWAERLDVKDIFHNDEVTIIEKRDVIVQRIRALKSYDDDAELIADELAQATEIDDFDEWWDAFYDWADKRRVWVATV